MPQISAAQASAHHARSHVGILERDISLQKWFVQKWYLHFVPYQASAKRGVIEQQVSPIPCTPNLNPRRNPRQLTGQDFKQDTRATLHSILYEKSVNLKTISQGDFGHFREDNLIILSKVAKIALRDCF